ncbi:unnamed protein product [Scytosiphon promiscuus]
MVWHPPWAPPRTAASGNSSPGGRSRLRSASVAVEEPSQNFQVDALGMAHILRTESLTAICLLIIAACALGFMMFFLRAILIPFAIAAVFLMYLLQPMVNYLCKPPRRWCDKCVKRRGEICCEGCFRVTKSRTYSAISAEDFLELERPSEPLPKGGCGCFNKPLVPRWLAVILALAIVLTALGTVGAIVYGSILNLQDNFGKYEIGAERIATLVDRWLKKYHYSIDEDFMPYALQNLRDRVPRALKLVVSSLQYFFLVAIFLVYLLIRRVDEADRPVKPIKSSVWGIIDLHIRRYIRLKTMVGILAATVVTAILWVLGVQMAYVFGIVTFVLNFIPNLGPMIATFLPMPLVILDPDISHLNQVLAFVLPTTAHLVFGNLVEPGLFGETFELSPVVVLLSLAFWGSLWGIPGMILAVPMVVITRIVCDHLDHPYAKTLMRLLEGNVFEAREDDTLIPNWNNGAGIIMGSGGSCGGGGGSGGGNGCTSGDAAALFEDGERADQALSAAEVGAGRRSRRTSSESFSVKGGGGDKRRYGTNA